MAFVLPWAAMAAHAASVVKVTPASGHPTAAISVSGTGFADAEAIDVYVDTTDTLLLVSSATGAFSGSVTIPATASPGAHYVTAIGRRSGDAAQKAFTVSTNWSEFHFGNGRKGLNPYENVIDATNVSDLDIAWYAATGGEIFSSPAVTNGAVYVVSADDKLYAYKATTGALLWSATTGGAIVSSPAVANGVVYLGSTDDNLYAYKATTGAPLWSATTDSSIQSSAVVANGVVYVGSEDLNFYAYALDAGNDAVYKRNIEPPSLNILHPDLRLEPARSDSAATDAESEQ
jgi:outer membrane protein assembly factor BamB